jgi:hypothetical protein
VTDDSNHSRTSDYAPELRRRADHLAELARSIERSLVMSLPETVSSDAACDRRTRLCEALLERNLHQLHRAADDLRVTAMRFRTRADELEAALRVAA